MAQKQVKSIIDINDHVNKLHGWQKQVIKIWESARHLILIATRQHGKSWLVDQALTSFIFRYKREGALNQALVVCSTAEQAFTVHFREVEAIMKDFPKELIHIHGRGGGSRIHVTIRRPWFNDTLMIQFIGAGNLDALRGETADFILLDETADLPLGSWNDILRPMLDHTGGRAVITGTAKGRHTEFYNIYSTFKALREKYPHLYAVCEFDLFTARLKPESFIQETYDYYVTLSLIHISEPTRPY